MAAKQPDFQQLQQQINAVALGGQPATSLQEIQEQLNMLQM